jgi:hypothetical protein
MPPEAGQETYDVTLKVNLAVAHYHPGLQSKRTTLGTLWLTRAETLLRLPAVACPFSFRA